MIAIYHTILVELCTFSDAIRAIAPLEADAVVVCKNDL